MTELVALDFEQLLALIDAGDKQQLRMILNDQYSADLCELLKELEMPKRVACFRLLDLDNASALLAELDAEDQRLLLSQLGDVGIVPLIANMSPDDAADLLSELPEEEAQSIINQMTDDEAAGDLYELMSFKEDTAGGIMSTDYPELNARMSVQEALNHLRATYEQVEDEIYDLFVVDEEGHLVGWLSVKDLLTAAPEALVESLMDTQVIQVTVDTDQEEAAEKIRKYDLLSLPVVDALGKLRGIITADDAIDVLEEEAIEDMYQTTGIDTHGAEGDTNLRKSVRQAVRARLPWLVITLGIESGSAMVITHFDTIIQQTVVAASFMPLLTSVTGSVAMQSTCIFITGTRKPHHWKAHLKNVWHELRVGMLLGASCGILTSFVSWLLKLQGQLGLVVGLSLFITMSVGVLIGTLVPLIFDRIGIEPAHASGPLITSLLDVCTMSIYLSIVHALLSHILQ